MELTFKLEEFEGPLDLLLHLIAKHKMNLYDINIVSLIDQYVALVQSAQTDSMDAASEFIEMAARLVQMKSYLLLPKSEEAERMRAELTGLLIEYSLCKEVAAKLKVRADNTWLVVREPAVVEFDQSYQLHHDPIVLQQAYDSMHGRKKQKRVPQQAQFEPIVQAPVVSVSTRIIHVLRGLMRGNVRCLKDLFDGTGSRSQTVATFLAVLELVRGGRITIDENAELQIQKHKRKETQGEGTASWT